MYRTLPVEADTARGVLPGADNQSIPEGEAPRERNQHMESELELAAAFQPEVLLSVLRVRTLMDYYRGSASI